MKSHPFSTPEATVRRFLLNNVLMILSQEETKKAVEEVKQTLTAQLKATKQMVADAALTAQNASRLVTY